MKPRQFYNTVVEMRKWQRTYFATRSQDALVKSKSLEKVIDNEIDRVTKILTQKELKSNGKNDNGKS